MPAPRDIRWSKQADAELEEIVGDIKRADELLYGLDIALAQHPEKGEPVPGTDLWALTAENCMEFPIIIYYRFDRKYVEVVSIKYAEEVENAYGEDDDS